MGAGLRSYRGPSETGYITGSEVMYAEGMQKEWLGELVAKNTVLSGSGHMG